MLLQTRSQFKLLKIAYCMQRASIWHEISSHKLVASHKSMVIEYWWIIMQVATRDRHTIFQTKMSTGFDDIQSHLTSVLWSRNSHCHSECRMIWVSFWVNILISFYCSTDMTPATRWSLLHGTPLYQICSKPLLEPVLTSRFSII